MKLFQVRIIHELHTTHSHSMVVVSLAGIGFLVEGPLVTERVRV